MESQTTNHLNENEVAARLGVPVRTLQQWRFQKRVLPFVKLGKLVRYRLCDIEKHIQNHLVEVAA